MHVRDKVSILACDVERSLWIAHHESSEHAESCSQSWEEVSDDAGLLCQYSVGQPREWITIVFENL